METINLFNKKKSFVFITFNVIAGHFLILVFVHEQKLPAVKQWRRLGLAQATLQCELVAFFTLHID
jgi:nitrogen fixation/metabolism regulation signal transduction histidine kinase